MITFYTIPSEPSGDSIVMDVDGVPSSVPPDPANSDYQRYLRWLENPDATYDAQQAAQNITVTE